MRITGKEILEFCEQVLKERNDSLPNMCRNIGKPLAFFSMWRSNPDRTPRIDAVVTISEYLGMTVSQIIGQREEDCPQDIVYIKDMLTHLSPLSRKAVAAVVRTYYDEEERKKRELNFG